MYNVTFLFGNDIGNILLIYLVIYFILSLFFKPDKSRIYCGVFAFCGPTNLTKGIYGMILSNIKLIGLLNDSRGGDNAGILINNEVVHTTGYSYKFSELLQKNTLENPNPEYSTVVIGHCRRGSVGGKDHKNAHPFEIYQNDNDHDFFMSGVHNGTVSNWKELAEKYAIDPEAIGNDSKTILTILSRQRNLKRKQPIFRVLEQYEGYGVFIWYFVDEPNTMYVFKGATQKSQYIKDLYEERPLFYYECPITKGIYFSSLDEPLKMIAGDKDKVHTLPCNVVYKITEGKFIKKDEVVINRDNIVNYTVYNNTSSRSSNKVVGFGQQRNLYEDNDDERYAATYGYGGVCAGPTVVERIFSESSGSKKEEEKTETKQVQTSKIDVKLNLGSNLMTSKLDTPSKSLSTLGKEGLIYRAAGFYYRKGKLLTGSYIINKLNYKCFALNDSEVQKDLQSNPQNYETKHFFEGYMVKDLASCDKLIGLKKLGILHSVNWKTDKTNDYMSHYCSQPVPGIFDNTIYYLNGIKADFRCERPPYSENKIYVFKQGLLEYVSYIKKDESVKIKDLLIDAEQLKRTASELGIPYTKTESEITEKEAIASEKFKNSILEVEVQEEIEIRNKDEKKIDIEDAYIIDSNEEEILEVYHSLLEKCQEQKDFIQPYLEKGLINITDLLSGNFIEFFKDSMADCLVNPQGGSKHNSPYYRKEGKDLVYVGLKKEDVGEFTIF